MHGQASGTQHARTAMDCSHGRAIHRKPPCALPYASRRDPWPLHSVAYSQPARLSRSCGELSHALPCARLLRTAPLSAAYGTRSRSASLLSRSPALRAHGHVHAHMRPPAHRARAAGSQAARTLHARGGPARACAAGRPGRATSSLATLRAPHAARALRAHTPRGAAAGAGRALTRRPGTPHAACARRGARARPRCCT